jgi:protein O-mannosyl-transferase
MMTFHLKNIVIKKSLSLLVITLLGIIFYSNTLKNQYTIDDEIVILENTLTKQGIKGIPKIFSSNYHSISGKSYGYRPVSLTTFAIEYQFVGQNPFVSHLINLLLYISVCILLYLFLYELGLKQHPELLFIFVILFTIHPIHTEVVNNIKSRDELLFMFFGLLSARFSLKYIDSSNLHNLLLAFTFINLAFLSKTSSVIFVVIIPFSIYFFRTVKITQLIKFIFLLGSSGLIYISITQLLINQSDTPVFRLFEYFENPLIHTSILEKIPAGMYILVYLLSLLCFPYPLSFYYGFNQVRIAGWGDWEVYLSIILHVTLFVYALMGLKQKRLTSYIILFYFVSIFPFSNLIVPVPGIVADRFLFMASIPFCLGVSYFILKIPNTIVKSLIVGSILILSFIWVFERNQHWYDSLTLMERDIKHLNDSFKANTFYASKLMENIPNEKDSSRKQQLATKSEQHFIRALEIYPLSYTANNNLAVLYLNVLNEPKFAQERLLNAIEIDPTLPDAKLNLGLAYKQLGNYTDVEKIMNEVIDEHPNLIKPYLLLSDFLNQQGEYEKEINILTIGTIKNPEEKRIILKLADAYAYLGDLRNAILYYEKFHEIEPSDELKEHILFLYNQLEE